MEKSEIFRVSRVRSCTRAVAAIIASGSLVDDDLIIMDERPFRFLPDHSPHLLDGHINREYGRNKALFGLEYQPEVLFRMDKRVFMGLGLVFNYSWGVLAHGRVTVDNEQTRYNGAILQGFSKIGLTVRLGWNGSRHF